MKYFLAKTDPETYHIDQFEREKETVWDGVRNPQAINVIKTMEIGDKVYIYHSMGQAAIMGLAEVTSKPRPDEKDAKSWVCEMRFIKKFEQPVTLKEIKATGEFDDWNLVYQSRLSTMAVPEKFVKWMEAKGVK